MRTVEEVRSDSTLNYFQRAEEISAIRKHQTENPPPPPAPAPLSQGVVEELRRIRARLTAQTDALKSHDAKVVMLEPLAAPLREAIRESVLGVCNISERSAVEAYNTARGKLALIEGFLANANTTRAEMCESVERELRQLTSTLQQAGLFDNIRPPEFTKGHTRESRVQMAIGLIESILAP